MTRHPAGHLHACRYIVSGRPGAWTIADSHTTEDEQVSSIISFETPEEAWVVIDRLNAAEPVARLPSRDLCG